MTKKIRRFTAGTIDGVNAINKKLEKLNISIDDVISIQQLDGMYLIWYISI